MEIFFSKILYTKKNIINLFSFSDCHLMFSLKTFFSVEIHFVLNITTNNQLIFKENLIKYNFPQYYIYKQYN